MFLLFQKYTCDNVSLFLYIYMFGYGCYVLPKQIQHSEAAWHLLANIDYTIIFGFTERERENRMFQTWDCCVGSTDSYLPTASNSLNCLRSVKRMEPLGPGSPTLNPAKGLTKALDLASRSRALVTYALHQLWRKDIMKNTKHYVEDKRIYIYKYLLPECHQDS